VAAGTPISWPYLRDNGKLSAAGAAFKPAKRSTVAFKKKLDANPVVFGKVVQGVFEPPSTYNFAPPGCVDMVVTFRNLHNCYVASFDGADAVAAEPPPASLPGPPVGRTESTSRKKT
jgi:predicted methyltransferase